MVVAKKYILVKYFHGEPQISDVQIVEETLPPLQDCEFLCKAECWSVDPYMRHYMNRYPLKSTIIGRQIARIVESKNNKYPVGRYVYGFFGWRDYTIAGGPNESRDREVRLLTKDYESFPLSYALGVFGRPGLSAYFGFLEICNPKEGETVAVSGAAGAVGSLVGQIAKIKGCKVIGFVGSESKCNWLKSEMGFDDAFNYKTVNVSKALREAAPNGVDCYFDNVGGELSYVIMNHMNMRGRISVCGSIASYNSVDVPKSSILQPKMVSSSLKMEGFLVNNWSDRFEEGVRQNMKWVKDGKLKCHETVTAGFEYIFQAFLGMLRGENRGKAIVKAE